MVLLGQTTTFLPLQSFCALRNTQMFTLSGLTDLTNALSKMVTAPLVTAKRGNIEVNIFFIHRRRKMCDSMKNTEMIF